MGIEALERQINPNLALGEEVAQLDTDSADILSGQLRTLEEIMQQVLRFDWEQHTKTGKILELNSFQKNTLLALLEEQMIPEPDMREILASFQPHMGQYITSTWTVHNVIRSLKVILSH